MPVETYAAVEPLADEWDAFADRIGAVPWLQPGWIEAWWQAFGRGELQLVAVRRDTELVAVAPLRRVAGELHSTTNWESPGFGFLAADDPAAAELARGLLAGRPRAVTVTFVEPEDRPMQELAGAAKAAGYRLLRRTMERSPYVEVSGGRASFEEALDAKLRRDLRRRERRLEELGRVEFEIADGSERLEQQLAEGFRVEAAAWKGARGSAIDSKATTRGFYRAIAAWAAARGTLRLGFLRLDGRSLAFDLALESGGVHYLLKTGYDDAYARFAPAKLLRRNMLERAFDQGLERYEFLGDQDPWKLEWTGETRERVQLQAFRGGPTGRLEWALYAHGKPLARRALRRRGR